MARVLIVDDSLYVRQILAKLLTDAGHTLADEAPNGRDGLRLYARHQPDLVILDINMPEMDGVAMLAALRQHHPEAKVVMCTALMAGPQAEAVRKLGIQGYVCKPFRSQDLLVVVEQALTLSLPKAA